MYDPTKPYKRQLIEAIKRTWDSPHVTVREGVYPIIEKKFDGPEVQHTDGIGTKGKFHWQARSFAAAAQDVLAMNLNDLILVRATPYSIQNHIIIAKDDHEAIIEIVEAFADHCQPLGIAMTGGETSIHDNFDGLDISACVGGIVGDQEPNQLQAGDALIGLPSSGLHSNGFTKVRETFGEKPRPEYVVPTTIYLDQVKAVTDAMPVHGMMHITGGAFAKLKDIAGDTDVQVRRDHSLPVQPIFQELFKAGVSDEDMHQTFNCGVGFVLAVPATDAEKAAELTGGAVIGEVVPGNGKIHVESKFSDQTVTL